MTLDTASLPPVSDSGGFATLTSMARPRSQEAHDAAVGATIDVLIDAGVEGVTLEEVAKRSGVAKSTLYRHFGSKEQLVATAARGCVTEHPTPDTGDLAEDLRILFTRYKETDDAGRIPDLLPMLIDASLRDPALREVVEELLAEKRQPIRTVLQLAQLRGEIGRDLDLEDALSIVLGPFSYRRLVERRATTPEFTDLVVRGAVAALRATATVTTP